MKMAVECWRLINSGFQTGAMNMALDEALLHSVANGDSLPVLRFYRWKPATVTLGYAQSTDRDLDLDFCRRVGVDVVRRATGGRAVLHDNEVTYAVIAPLNKGLFAGSVLDCYRVIAEVLLMALNHLGLAAELVPGKSRSVHQNTMKAVCFSSPSQYELVIDGCKVAGSAQRRFGNAFLQHGSIPIDMDIDLLRKALRSDVEGSIEDSLQSVGWLNRWAGEPLAVNHLEMLLADVFSRHLQLQWVNSEPTPLEIGQAARIMAEKFANPDWNLKC
jgi:lipoate-protein ligase A